MVVAATGRVSNKSLLSGKNKLIDDIIDYFSSKYSSAIRGNQNKTVESMRRSCLCTLLHCTSTDENPHHELCPEGAESWCFFQKALALGLGIKPHDEELTKK